MSANATLEKMPRAARAAHVATLRAAGWSGIAIAEHLGISRAYAYELISDPEGCLSRERKKQYGGACAMCGGPTSYLSGGGTAKHCKDCVAEMGWSHSDIIAAINMWADEHGGIPPRSRDWGNGNLGRHPDFNVGQHPHAQTCSSLFGSFNKAIFAAGYQPHQERDPQRFSAPVISAAIDWLGSGEDMQHVAERIGVSAQNLRLALKRRGYKIGDIPGSTAHTRHRRRDEFIARWNANTTVPEIADEFGITENTVRSWAFQLRRRGFPVNRRSRKAAA